VAEKTGRSVRFLKRCSENEPTLEPDGASKQTGRCVRETGRSVRRRVFSQSLTRVLTSSDPPYPPLTARGLLRNSLLRRDSMRRGEVALLEEDVLAEYDAVNMERPYGERHLEDREGRWYDGVGHR
jgi:hypothetical protein